MELLLVGIVRSGDTVVLQSNKKLTVTQKKQLSESLSKLKERGVVALVTEPPFKTSILRGGVN